MPKPIKPNPGRTHTRLLIALGISIACNVLLAIDDNRQYQKNQVATEQLTILGAKYKALFADAVALLETIRRDPQMQEWYQFAKAHRTEIEQALAARDPK